jgi:hypothetical protein
VQQSDLHVRVRLLEPVSGVSRVGPPTGLIVTRLTRIYKLDRTRGAPLRHNRVLPTFDVSN